MTAAGTFDAAAMTERLQDAVRTHDREVLQALVAERFLFTSTRVDTRIGKAAWIDWACAVEWIAFDLRELETVVLGDVVVVAHVLDQRIQADGAPAASTWTTTDVWAVEGGTWRLVHRHPELRDAP